MAIYKHAMTKEGAIAVLTRHQVSERGGVKPHAISKAFLDAYSKLSDNDIKALYKETFEIELEIVKPRKDGKKS